MSDRLRRGLEATAVGIVVLVILAATADHYGLGYDEPVYMSRAQEASAWLSLLERNPGLALSDQGIEPYWNARSEQQLGFVKLWGALTTPIFAGVLPALAALRSGTLILVALLCASLYLFVASLWGRLEAVAAVGVLLTMPRVFAHSHLFALDAPVMATTFIALHLVFISARERSSPERSWWWAAAAGAMWGLAMGCKVNGMFVPLIALPWLALCARDALLPVVVCGAALGPLTFWLSWPWLWHDTPARLASYVRFHGKHWQISVTYFGRMYAPAPWHYPLVMTLITVPVGTLAAIAAGAWRMIADRGRVIMGGGWRGRWADPAFRRSAAGALIGWGLLVNYLMNSLPGTPKYNGCRLFLPVFPLLAVVAAIGVGWAIRALASRIAASAHEPERTRRLMSLVLLLVAGALAARTVMECHPHQLSYYNAVIGGLRGAERRGMEVTYWGETYLDGAGWLNQHAPRMAVAWIEPPGVEATMGVYRTLGLLRPDIRTVAGPEALAGADYAVFQNKVTEFSDTARDLLDTRTPIVPAELDGVPLIYIFELRDTGGNP